MGKSPSSGNGGGRSTVPEALSRDGTVNGFFAKMEPAKRQSPDRQALMLAGAMRIWPQRFGQIRLKSSDIYALVIDITWFGPPRPVHAEDVGIACGLAVWHHQMQP
jgi:hypothetical protein